MRAILLAVMLILVPSARAALEWEDPAINERNRRAPHATLNVYGDAAAARAGEIADTRSLSLAGDWKFNWSPRPPPPPRGLGPPRRPRPGGLPHLPQHPLPLGRAEPALHPARQQSRRLLPPRLRPPGPSRWPPRDPLL